ncbi:MAG: tRNA lysidine(34) synthetase TilS [Rhodospirillaceae bacterium]|jgi:tRNA(Ile)-lysidine synthase|nr:tRNA lysidine(34) synthetase TilS [Rhodospirillaceae bacterium]MBT4772108.1 tRNA lysidine(34) synthetase TilS [Rhodospirillaceae bacterium]MBT5359395.1 tRNA lysidine(34) synthetase TilS [Rhodospirillaceae bacterium]MBT5768412.1 tRNA lysidine(34) synthetase TilS [Rhodospirillaceae bacterium]MBT6309557.1 tRNA lysidine(34) synthetase TilS [Rhodospirillaceae bacterium]
MQRLGPFETDPHLAVGVSGGRDSLALTLLAAEWAAARNGLVTAVTLDHGLRETSAAEAGLVSEWMAQHGIPHHTLVWPDSPGLGQPGMGASEAAARTARYGLLEAFCRDHEILHLLVGHHLDDQLETQVMRRARSSGAFGQAGMPAVRELAQARILRPFLDIPRARMTATLHVRGQSWIEDPSNQDAQFARARMRMGQSTRPVVALDKDARMARSRIAAEREISRVAARAVAVHPAGFATLNPALLAAADRDAGVRLIGSLVRCIGGRVYAPRGKRLDRLAEKMIDDGLDGGATLGGCTVQPCGKGLVRIARELAAIDEPRHVIGEGDRVQALEWDGRFHVSFPAADAPGMALDGESRIGAVGKFLASGVPEHPDSPRYDALPHTVRMTLPAICRAGQFHVCALPFSSDSGRVTAKARFAPKIPAAGAVFATG